MSDKSKKKDKSGPLDQFIQVEAGSNELSVKQIAMESNEESTNKMERDRISFSRAVSLYRASNNNSVQSSMKGTRWSFG